VFLILSGGYELRQQLPGTKTPGPRGQEWLPTVCLLWLEVGAFSYSDVCHASRLSELANECKTLWTQRMRV
jgi:hypothetical protein